MSLVIDMIILHLLLATKAPTYPKPYILFFTTFSIVGATPTLFLMRPFLIVSHVVIPHIQNKILIFDTLILFLCWFFTVQHSISYNIIDLTII